MFSDDTFSRLGLCLRWAQRGAFSQNVQNLVLDSDAPRDLQRDEPPISRNSADIMND